VEKFIRHNSFAVESFVVAGRPHLLGIAERRLPPFPLCISLGSALPDRLSPEQRQAVLAANRKAVQALGLSCGPVHIDMVFDEDRRPHIVDVGPRCVGGPLGWALIPAATGFDMVEAVVRQAIGEALPAVRVLNDGRYYAHRHLTVDKDCVLEAIDADAELMEQFKILLFRPHAQPGDTLHPIQNSRQRYGNIIAWGHSFEEATSNLDAFAERVLRTRRR
jgi:biotin carboxylase